jgi:hypothetical protein
MPALAVVTKDSEVFSGADKVLQFTVKDASEVIVNITGWALKWVLATKPVPAAGVTVLLSKTTGLGITIPVGTDGVCQVAIADTDTDDIPSDRVYYHELRRTDAGLEDVLSYGDFYLRQSPVR